MACKHWEKKIEIAALEKNFRTQLVDRESTYP